ncbi:hypothetical protein ABXV22_10610 [Vibrio rotiferianus]|uniref:hypothetical protein n=1 Tax=Vibrio rotiferianus TaxID=190895 RepID=UPI0033934E02
MALNEADTCRVYVTPKLKESGWESNPSAITEQYTFTDGRVQFKGSKVQRGEALLRKSKFPRTEPPLALS